VAVEEKIASGIGPQEEVVRGRVGIIDKNGKGKGQRFREYRCTENKGEKAARSAYNLKLNQGRERLRSNQTLKGGGNGRAGGGGREGSNGGEEGGSSCRF